MTAIILSLSLHARTRIPTRHSMEQPHKSNLGAVVLFPVTIKAGQIGYVPQNFLRVKRTVCGIHPQRTDSGSSVSEWFGQRCVLPLGSLSAERVGSRSHTSPYVAVHHPKYPKTAVSTPTIRAS